MSDTCKTCKFFKMSEDENARGECRRYPPAVLAAFSNTQGVVFSPTEENEWCGEHKPTEITATTLNG